MILALVSPAIAPCAADDPADAIAGAVRELGDPDYEIRERAFQVLWAAGRAAEPALRAAAARPDPEVSARARELLEHLELGIEPTTPAEVVELVRLYRSGDMETKGIAVERLLGLGGPAYEPLSRLARHEDAPELRQAIYRLLGQRARDAPAALIAEGEVELAAELLEAEVAAGDSSARRHYAAYLAVEGRVEEAIARRERTGAPDPFLAHLYRLAGEKEKALGAVSREDAWLEEALLLESGAWGALAARRGAADGIEDLGFLAAFRKRAGDRVGGEEAMRALRAAASGKPGESWFAAEAFLLDDRPEEGIALLGEVGRAVAVYALRCDRLEYEEAFEWRDDVLETSSEEAPRLEIHHARTLCSLGEEAEALRLLRAAPEAIDAAADFGSIVYLVETSLELGYRDLAFAHAAWGIERAGSEVEREWILGRLFDGRGGVAARWWGFLAERHPGEENSARLERLAAILGARRDAPVFEVEVRAAQDALERRQGGALAGWLRALASACESGGREADALGFLERAAEAEGGAGTWTRLGDRHAAAGRWGDALRSYERALGAKGASPATHWLRGRALQVLGREEEGAREMHRARLMALADSAARFELAEAMRRAGRHDEAAAEDRLVLLTSSPSSWEYMRALWNGAEAAAARGDHAAAAEALDRAILPALATSTAFLEPRSYLEGPHRVHEWRARGLLAAGDPDRALAEAETCLAILPADVESAIVFITGLEAAGRREAADRLFARVYDRYTALTERFPGAARLHHALARLALGCRRRLEDGERHAALAVEIDPEDPEYARTAARFE